MISIIASIILAQSLSPNVPALVKQYRPADGGSVWYSEVTRLPDYGMSAFGNTRTAEPFTLFDAIHHYSLDSEEWRTYSTNDSGITHIPSESSILLSAVADGGIAALRSHGQFRYQAGKGARVLETAVLGPVDAGQIYRVGFYDDSDGLGWKYSGSGLQVFVRSSVDGGVNETLYSVDAGASYKPYNGNIYELTFQWLGVGTVRAYLNGTLVKQIDHAGTLPFVYMKTATLPVTFEANAGSQKAEMKAICTSVQSEGGSIPPGTSFSAKRDTDLTIAGNTSNVPVISIRPSGSYGGLQNRMQIWPTRIWCTSDNKRVRIDLRYNPSSMTSAAFTSANAASGVEYDVSTTAIVNGADIGSFGVASNASQEYNVSHIFGITRRHLERHAFLVPSGAGLDPALDTLTVVASNPGTGNASVVCGIDWVEIR